jgi:hypothetical protein
MPIPPPFFIPKRNFGCRVETDVTLWGHRAVVLQNELLRVTVLAGRGADIVEFLYKPLDVDFMWANPSGPLRSETSLPPGNPLRAFDQHYAGGWQELFPHGSRPVEAYGKTDLYQHGEVWGLPWDVRVEEDTPKRVSVIFSCRTRQTPFVLERRMTLEAGKPVLQFDETAHNLGRRGLDVMWGHHPAFGAPLLSPDCIIYAAAKTLNVDLKHRTTWPVGEYKGKREDFSRIPGARSGKGRMLYLEDLIDGWYALVNPKLKLGIGMRWNKRQFPVVWIWQEAGACKHSPWFGHAYATALEPFTNLPFARERKEKLLRIPAGGKVNTKFEAIAIPGGKPVRSARDLKF